MSTTIRVTWVRRAGMYHIDEVGDGGVVRAEISPAWVCDEAFAEYLAALVAGYRGLGVSRGAVDDDAVMGVGAPAGAPEAAAAGGVAARRLGPAPGLEQRVGVGS